VYRTDALTFALAARMVRVAHVGLPNLVLARRAFPELLQGDVTALGVAAAARDVLGAPERYRVLCDDVRAALRAPLDARPPSERVATTLRSWLE
jgi:lipid-A-disaccharide synthase